MKPTVKIVSLVVFSSLLLVAPGGFAQNPPTPAVQPAPAEETPSPDPVAEQLKAMQKDMAEQKARIEALEKERADAAAKAALADKETAELKAALAETKENVELINASEMSDDQNKLLSIYGFFDITFLKSWFDQENSLLITQNPPKSTFMMNNINLFFKSEMTDTLEAMIETGLSFAPLGYETNLPIDAYVDGQLNADLVDSSVYTRVNTYVPGGIASQSLRYGSISIIRAYLDWKPRDWLSFRVGQYLTPYGIWNEEHASTVLTGIFYPNMMNWDMMPKTQLGAQVFGSVFPSDFFQLKYAVTLSNGRGPIDTVMDLDENKAVGLRAQGIFSGNKWKVTAGGYGYYGKYSDVERHAEVYLNADLSQDLSSGSPFGGSIIVTNKYQEWLTSADLSFEFYGVKLFGEYLWRRVNYLNHPLMFSDYEFAQNGDFQNRRSPSFIGQSAYGILAWTLPLEKIIGSIQITPYVGYDWSHMDDTLDWYYQKTARAGLNVRPSPFVALKVEGIFDMFDDLLGGQMNSLAGQVAVSF